LAGGGIQPHLLTLYSEESRGIVGGALQRRSCPPERHPERLPSRRIGLITPERADQGLALMHAPMDGEVREEGTGTMRGKEQRLIAAPDMNATEEPDLQKVHPAPRTVG
jgi:hypothetical protein